MIYFDSELNILECDVMENYGIEIWNQLFSRFSFIIATQTLVDYRFY
jgi:hypothetical protein